MRTLLLLTLSVLFTFQLQAQDYELWGMTSGGHTEDDWVDVLYDEGVIFSLGEDENNLSVQYSLRYQGRRPNFSSPMEASNGKFYSMTRFGGIYDHGVLYEYDKGPGHYRKLHDFQSVESGKEPFGNVYQASDGKLYGTTKQGGEFDQGVFFSYDLTSNTFTKLLDFLDDDHGKFPYGAPYEAETGKLIGMTNSGGDFNQGVIYEYDMDLGTFQVLLHFTSVATGGHPRGDFIEADNGKLYGVTYDGGAANHGVIFEYDAPSNTLVKIHDFDQLTSGQFPLCKLVQGSNGKLYGTTSNGGINNHGVLFEYDLSNSTFTNLFEFNSASTGEAPSGGLVQASNGLLYGTTQYGGPINSGLVYSYDFINGIQSIVHEFDDTFSGENPIGGFSVASDGELLGMSSLGGNGDFGTCFAIEPTSDEFIKLFDWEGDNGSGFNGSLIQTEDGLLYGLAHAGGIYNLGVLFEYNLSTGLYTKLLDFNGEGNGAQGSGKLVEAEDGLLYGVTSSGGIGGWGTLFSFDRNTNEHTLLMEFDSPANGRIPIGGMIEAPNGKLYGLTSDGGDGFVGVLYEYDPETNAYAKKYDFDPVDGGQSHGNLMLSTDGLLYGMASGAQGLATGVIFSHNPVDAQTSIVHEFSNPLNGANPHGSLVELDGLFYGMTAFGGVNGLGVLFSYDPSMNDYETLVDFDGITNGAHPYGTLIAYNNNKLYGCTNDGNEFTRGLVFEYLPQTNVFTVIEEFDGSNGNNPLYGELTPIDMSFAVVGVQEHHVEAQNLLYPNPTSAKIFFTKGGMKQVDLYSITGQQIAQFQNRSELDLSQLSAGIYLLNTIDYNGRKESHRLIKE